MRKKLAVLFSLVLATLISMLMVSPAQAHIERFYWVPPYVFKGYDNYFYHDDIVGYETGTTASLKIPVYNDYHVGPDYRPINVSAVKVEFDWGINYTSAEVSETSPVQIAPFERHTFTISFTVPLTTVASNAIAHTYTIHVEHVNATTGPKNIVDTWSRDWDHYDPAYKFAVFSADQADALELYTELSAVFEIDLEFDTAKGKVLWSEAVMHGSIGMSHYRSGKFTEANATLHTASDLVDQAFEAEDERGSKLEDAMINYYNAAVTEAYAWLLFGLGMILIGIGAIIYAAKYTAKKPKAA